MITQLIFSITLGISLIVVPSVNAIGHNCVYVCCYYPPEGPCEKCLICPDDGHGNGPHAHYFKNSGFGSPPWCPTFEQNVQKNYDYVVTFVHIYNPDYVEPQPFWGFRS